MRHLITASFALAGCAAELIECFEKERLNVVRLQAAGFRTLHILSHTGDAAGVHHLVGERAFFEQLQEVRPANGVGDSVRQPGLNFRSLAITDCLDEQLTE